MGYTLKRTVSGLRGASKFSTVSTFDDMSTLNDYMLSDVEKLSFDLWRVIGWCTVDDGEYIDSTVKPILCKAVYTIRPIVSFCQDVTVTYTIIEK